MFIQLYGSFKKLLLLLKFNLSPAMGSLKLNLVHISFKKIFCSNKAVQSLLLPAEVTCKGKSI